MTALLKRCFSFLLTAFVVQLGFAQNHAEGFTAMQLEDWDKAIQIYTALTKSNASDQSAFLSLGSAYLAKGEKAKAEESFKSAFNAKPEGALAFVANGRVMMLQNNMAEADNQFKKAAKAGKKDVSAMRQIGESFLYAPPGVKPNFTRAEESLKAAVDVASKDITTLMTLGYCYKEMPNGGLAAQQYEIAEGLDPKNPLIKFMLAKVYKAAKLPERFVEYCDKAIALQPNYTLALRAKAEYYYFGRKWEMALKAYEELVTKGSNVIIEDEMQLANCLFINKKYKECADLVEKIIKKDGSKTYLRRLLGYCYHDTGEYQKGLDVMKEYFVKVSPEKIISSDYLYYGRLMLKTKGDSTAAIENLKKGIMLDSTAWAVNKEIAELNYTRKANNEAVKHWKMYLDSVAKQEPTDLYKYGLALYFDRTDSTRFEKAEKIFVKVAELVPKATLGWGWAAKSAKNLDVTPEQIAANPELAKQYGKALMYYEKYVEVATDKEKNKKDLLDAYSYMAYCYLVKQDATKFNDITAKWLELETDTAKQEYVREMQASFGKDTPAPAPGQTPPAGGGKG